MALFRCNSCQATYHDAQPAGAPYAHVCGPLRNPKFQPDPKKKGFDDRPTVPNPNPRNENILRDATLHVVGIVAEGKGRTKLED